MDNAAAPSRFGTLLFPHRLPALPWKVVLSLGAALATAVAAQVTIPRVPVPYTLQTCAVLLSGLLLGAEMGFAAQMTYLVLGGIGLPVFAELHGGAQTLVGPTAGYLWAFPIAAWITGRLTERGWDRSVLKALLMMVAAQTVILATGTGWLALYLGNLKMAWLNGTDPFLVPEIGKALALMLFMPLSWKAMEWVKRQLTRT